jgi:peroxiredoxin
LADRTEWQVFPRLSRGQELVYKGTFTEETVGKGVQFSRSYRLDSLVFVLDTPPRGLDVAFHTTFKLRTARPTGMEEPKPASVRLELVKVDVQGRLTADPTLSLLAPLDGPATVETGAFVEIPRGRVKLNQSWEVSEEGRPVRTWKVLGTEAINGISYLKLEGVQQSPDWEQPRADRMAWRRRDVVWLEPRLGVAYKVERTIERKEPAHRDPSQRLFVQYELQSQIRYPGRFFEDRKREILQVQKFNEAVIPLLPNPTKQGPKTYDALLAKINNHLDNQPPTPYREAILQVKRRVESARRGETPAAVLPDLPGAEATTATTGQRAPDFVTTNLLTRESFRLRRSLGRPILMVFYTPSSLTVREVLRFSQTVQDAHRQGVTVLAFAISDDVEQIRKQQTEFRLSFPILSGKGLRQTYAVDATPKLIVLDGDGVVRGSYVGWGPETGTSVTEELKQWLRADPPPKSGTEVKGTESGSGPPRR